jgi:translation initiation factor IF-3
MAHKEFGFQQVEKFIANLVLFGHPDAPAKLIGKGINVMLSPLPRAKRAKNPRQAERDAELAAERAAGGADGSETPDEPQEIEENAEEFAGNGNGAGEADPTPGE